MKAAEVQAKADAEVKAKDKAEAQEKMMLTSDSGQQWPQHPPHQQEQ